MKIKNIVNSLNDFIDDIVEQIKERPFRNIILLIVVLCAIKYIKSLFYSENERW